MWAKVTVNLQALVTSKACHNYFDRDRDSKADPSYFDKDFRD